MASSKQELMARIENLSGDELSILEDFLNNMQNAEAKQRCAETAEHYAGYLIHAGKAFSRIPIASAFDKYAADTSGVYSRMQDAERIRCRSTAKQS